MAVNVRSFYMFREICHCLDCALQVEKATFLPPLNSRDFRTMEYLLVGPGSLRSSPCKQRPGQMEARRRRVSAGHVMLDILCCWIAINFIGCTGARVNDNRTRVTAAITLSPIPDIRPR